MTEIEFSIIANADSALAAERQILAGFSQQHELQFHLAQMHWDQAWRILWVHALPGKGSHVGSTWGTSLGAMEALRPCSTSALAKIGAPDGFIPFERPWSR